jgi:hypothetical protein
MQPLILLAVWMLVAAELNSAGAFHCNGVPEDAQTSKSVNSNFHLRIGGNSNKYSYVPGGVYTGMKH